MNSPSKSCHWEEVPSKSRHWEEMPSKSWHVRSNSWHMPSKSCQWEEMPSKSWYWEEVPRVDVEKSSPAQPFVDFVRVGLLPTCHADFAFARATLCRLCVSDRSHLQTPAHENTTCSSQRHQQTKTPGEQGCQERNDSEQSCHERDEIEEVDLGTIYNRALFLSSSYLPFGNFPPWLARVPLA